MNEYAVAGSYALVGYDNTDVGITQLLRRRGARWFLVVGGGGQIQAETILRYVPSMPPAVAKSLERFAESQDR